MLKHLDQHNILVDCQHGFRLKRSCETQLLTLSHELLNNLHTGKQTDLIILDFSKAFDKKLLRKLDNYGIRGNIWNWISAFLNNRQQRVVLDGEISSQMPVVSGVPQRSVLGRYSSLCSLMTCLHPSHLKHAYLQMIVSYIEQ
jgi:hypothetical protein